MTSRNMTDPTLIPFIAQNLEKEKWLRMHWVEEHMDELNRATQMNREPTNYTSTDIKRALITACMPSLARCAVEGAVNKRTVSVKDIDLLNLDKKTKESEPTMKPLTDEERAALYESKEAYLKLRHRLPPYKKYNYLECVNWEHGWNLVDSEIRLRGPAHGNIYHLQRMEGIGPEPDPVYYQDFTDAYTICNDV